MSEAKPLTAEEEVLLRGSVVRSLATPNGDFALYSAKRMAQVLATLDASRAEADRLRQERDEARSHLDQAVEHAAIGWDRAAAAGTARDVAERDAAQARALAAKLAEGLAPFAWVGQWLFARDLPDEEPIVTITGAGRPVNLTRGMFKAAHTASTRARAQGIRTPKGEKGEG